MLNHGFPVIVVSKRLGHAKPSITLEVCGRLILSFQGGVADMTDDIITPTQLHQSAPSRGHRGTAPPHIGAINPNTPLLSKRCSKPWLCRSSPACGDDPHRLTCRNEGCPSKRVKHCSIKTVKIKHPHPWGCLSGRNKTRTCGLFCVSLIAGESIKSMSVNPGCNRSDRNVKGLGKYEGMSTSRADTTYRMRNL